MLIFLFHFSSDSKTNDPEIEALNNKIRKLEIENDRNIILLENLERIFTPGQIRRLYKSNKKSRVRWSAEDIAAAIALRSVSPKCYHHLRNCVGIPLPSHSTLCKWESRSKKERGE